jgi:hypothetical protein
MSAALKNHRFTPEKIIAHPRRKEKRIIQRAALAQEIRFAAFLRNRTMPVSSNPCGVLRAETGSGVLSPSAGQARPLGESQFRRAGRRN